MRRAYGDRRTSPARFPSRSAGSSPTWPAGHLALTGSTASQLVRERVDLGPVRRGRDPHDRRRHALELTEAGRGHLAVVAYAPHLLEAETAALLGPGDADEPRPLLLRLPDPAAHAG